MGHLLGNWPNISRNVLCTRNTCFNPRKIDLCDSGKIWKNGIHSARISEKRRSRPFDSGRSWKNGVQSAKISEKRSSRAFALQCCSAGASISSAEKKVKVNGNLGEMKENLGLLVSEYGWKVRRLVEEDEGEIRKVTQIQAEAFHVPVALFNDLFFDFFQAEVLSGLIYKLRNSPPDRYACLVAEQDGGSSESEDELVGVVDVTVLRDESVLEHLQGVEEYLYISGIAVFKKFRRQKIATVLLKACDMLSIIWGFQYLALRAYEDDIGAQKLYSNAGYRVVSRDPAWISSWIGRKRRVLMIKQTIQQK